jgi:hypothetical protein
MSVTHMLNDACLSYLIHRCHPPCSFSAMLMEVAGRCQGCISQLYSKQVNAGASHHYSGEWGWRTLSYRCTQRRQTVARLPPFISLPLMHSPTLVLRSACNPTASNDLVSCWISAESHLSTSSSNFVESADVVPTSPTVFIHAYVAELAVGLTGTLILALTVFLSRGKIRRSMTWATFVASCACLSLSLGGSINADTTCSRCLFFGLPLAVSYRPANSIITFFRSVPYSSGPRLFLFACVIGMPTSKYFPQADVGLIQRRSCRCCLRCAGNEQPVVDAASCLSIMVSCGWASPTPTISGVPPSSKQ